MSGPRRLLSTILPPLALALSLLAPPAAGREVAITQGADYHGADYATVKEVELDACESACLADTRCRAFTYNTKARWCFLKEGVGELRPFPAAVSGRVVATAPAAKDTAPAAPVQADLAATRTAELAFLPRSYLDEARALAKRIAGMAPPGMSTQAKDAAALAAQGANLLAKGEPARAADAYAGSLRLAAGRPGPWLGLAQAAAAVRSDDWQAQQRYKKDASAAAINAYLRSEAKAERAAALAALGQALTQREAWRPAIRATRAALALGEAPGLRAEYDTLVTQHGFRVSEHQVDSDAASPRICIRFSEPLVRNRPDLADFVKVADAPKVAVETQAQQICIDGVVHGGRYRIQVRAGLPSAEGETLAKTAELDIYVRDRAPMARFLGRAYVLPKGGDAAIPVVSVNTDTLEARVYRIGDRALAAAQAEGTLFSQLDTWKTEQISDRSGEQVWNGVVEVKPDLNREVTTAVPVGALVKDLKPGVYAMTARARNAPKSEDSVATQWFVVSDLGLAGYSGNDGLHALVRSLSGAGPIAGVTLQLIARNDEVLGQATTDGLGYARLDPGLLRGTGGNAPALLVAQGPGGDFGLLDLTQTPFDLSDRGVEGRPAPKPMDVYLVTERGAYRPGETVHVTALVRDARAQAGAQALGGGPLTLILKRPDGVERERVLTQDRGLGARQVDLALSPSAQRGTWRAALYADPKGTALAEVAFLVEDFEPERLTFTPTSTAATLNPADPPGIDIEARYLFGAPAAGLAIEGETRLSPTDGLPGLPGYRFGVADEEVQTGAEPLPPATTDAQGRATLVPQIPEMPPSSRPLEAQIDLRVLDGSGRPVERSLKLPVATQQGRIGVKPLFDGSVEQGGSARFEVLALGADGARQAIEGLRWTLSRVQTSFQWYQKDGQWDYEPITSTQRVADGTLDLAADAPGHIEAKVDWGAYRLDLTDASGAALPTSVPFEAGWYVAPGAADTPDLLKVSLDKAAYQVGEKARARIEPRFPGTALVMVLDDRLIAMTQVEVPQGGTTVDLPVTEAWGPGAYVTAVLYRPMDLAAKRMPARALGLAWAAVDPGTRRLAPALAIGDQASPRGPMDIGISVPGLAAGETAYVTVAAVDQGILNLTRYQAPDPDGWYFGQRKLGMELRDLYGRLIDRMQGVPGVVRSGGDGGLSQIQGPPPTEELVAFFSGVVKLDAQGRAQVRFDLPDFNGTVRVMAMAWTQAGVGHAVKDVLVRDPVVMAAALPRFLAPGDRSRLGVELTHVEGPAGDMVVSLEAAGGAVASPAGAQTVSLAQGGRARVEFPLSAQGVGDAALTLHLRTPDGRDLTKALTLGVRANAPAMAQTRALPLPPGGQVSIGAEALAGLVPGTATALVSVGGAGRLDIPGVLMALDLYPYGCSEQLVSRALPLLYLDQVALAAGLPADADAKERVRTAIGEVLANQSASGGFGAWGALGDDAWLDAYVTDFLTRARERGFTVPAVAFDNAVDNLRNRLAYAGDFTDAGQDIAYALYVLARNGRAAIGDLRYYAEAKLDAFATPLAKAQIAAGLALYGDKPRADMAFQAALTDLDSGTDDGAAWRPDFGSALRDAAALLTLAAEAGSQAIDLDGLAARVAALREAARYTSTQDDAWTLLAAQALIQGAAKPDLAIDGQAQTGALFRRLDGANLLARPLVIANRGKAAEEVLMTVTGVPVTPPAAGGQGYRIQRAYYDLQGRGVDPTQVAQGDRLIAVVTVSGDGPRQARLILDDPLPAGFEIDNPHLIKAGDLAGIPWMGLEEVAAHTEFRSDRFIAALDRGAEDRPQFQLAYRLRAVSPGTFAQPAASVVDMYRPQWRAWTGTGVVEVKAAGGGG